MLTDIDKFFRGLQALTLAHVAIETRHNVCRTPVVVRKRAQHLPALVKTPVSLPLLLEWHPETPIRAMLTECNEVRHTALMLPMKRNVVGSKCLIVRMLVCQHIMECCLVYMSRGYAGCRV